MDAPMKPWERAGALQNQAHSSLSPSLSSATGGVMPSPGPTSSGTAEVIQGAGRPPLPPRPGSTANQAGYGYGSGSMYGGYGSSLGGLGGYGSSFGGLGGYGGMSSPFMSGGFGGGYSPYNRMGAYGMGHNDNNSFVNQAEASAQGAFQSVESVVSAMSSISMMLESTYCALHNSFRAVLGVADQFTRLKVQLTNVAASFAIFRFLRWLYRRTLVLLRLRQAGLSEDAWVNAWKKSAAEAQERFPSQHKSSWPLVVFMAITFGGPYLIWRMVSNITGAGGGSSNQGWIDGTADHVVGECKYEFIADKDDELSIGLGQRINLAPSDMQPRLRENDWLLASDGTKSGMVPANYVRVLGTRKGKGPSMAAQEDRSIPAQQIPQQPPTSNIPSTLQTIAEDPSSTNT